MATPRRRDGDAPCALWICGRVPEYWQGRERGARSGVADRSEQHAVVYDYAVVGYYPAQVSGA